MSSFYGAALIFYVLGLPIYVWVTLVLGAEWGPNLGEPNKKTLWIVWFPIYGPIRLFYWLLRKNPWWLP